MTNHGMSNGSRPTPIVTFAPKSPHSRRNGRLPYFVSGARISSPRSRSTNSGCGCRQGPAASPASVSGTCAGSPVSRSSRLTAAGAAASDSGASAAVAVHTAVDACRLAAHASCGPCLLLMDAIMPYCDRHAALSDRMSAAEMNAPCGCACMVCLAHKVSCSGQTVDTDMRSPNEPSEACESQSVAISLADLLSPRRSRASSGTASMKRRLACRVQCRLHYLQRTTCAKLSAPCKTATEALAWQHK